MRRNSVLFGAMVVALTTPFVAQAQQSNTQGFMGNIHLSGASLTRPEPAAGGKLDAESGGGFGARLGWGFSPNFTVFLGMDAATLDFKGEGAEGNYGLVHLDFGAIYHFANTNRRLVPYLEVALSGRAIGSNAEDGSGTSEEFVQGGSGYTLGGGINYHFTRSAALNLGLSVSVGDFENAEIDNVEIPGSEGSATSSRLSIGMTFFPMKR